MKQAWGIVALIVTVIIGWQVITAASFMTMFAATVKVDDPCADVDVIGSMSGPIRLPVTGAYAVTSEFGMRFNPGPIGNGDLWLHDGIDLAMTNKNGPIVAMAAGVVKTASSGVYEGNFVVLQHGDGVESRILHLSQTLVKPGEKVWPGRTIGMQGTTGNSSGEHAHFTILVGGRATEPRAWMKQHGVEIGAGGTAPGPVDSPGAGQDVVASIRKGSDPNAAAGGQVGALPGKIGVWQGEQIANAAHVIRVGQRMKLPARAIAIGIMTAMGESSLRNVDHGDAARADTIGLFQNGPERGPYAKRMDPEGAAEIFFTHLVKVPNYLELEPTIAAHKTQRNADPYHYQRWWSDAVTMLAELTKDPKLLESLPVSGDLEGCKAPRPGEASGGGVAEIAQKWLGTPYSWGGGDIGGPTKGIYTSPALDGTRIVGFDCSGLVLHAVAKSTGIQLPHSAELQGTDSRGTTIARDWAQMKPGDVISFSGDGSGAAGTWGHVGIYAGDGQMIHAPSVGDVVKKETLKTPYWQAMSWRIKRYAPTTTK